MSVATLSISRRDQEMDTVNFNGGLSRGDLSVLAHDIKNRPESVKHCDHKHETVLF